MTVTSCVAGDAAGDDGHETFTCDAFHTDRAAQGSWGRRAPRDALRSNRLQQLACCWQLSTACMPAGSFRRTSGHPAHSWRFWDASLRRGTQQPVGRRPGSAPMPAPARLSTSHSSSRSSCGTLQSPQFVSVANSGAPATTLSQLAPTGWLLSQRRRQLRQGCGAGTLPACQGRQAHAAAAAAALRGERRGRQRAASRHG